MVVVALVVAGGGGWGGGGGNLDFESTNTEFRIHNATALCDARWKPADDSEAQSQAAADSLGKHRSELHAPAMARVIAADHTQHEACAGKGTPPRSLMTSTSSRLVHGRGRLL